MSLGLLYQAIHHVAAPIFGLVRIFHDFLVTHLIIVITPRLLVVIDQIWFDARAEVLARHPTLHLVQSLFFSLSLTLYGLFGREDLLHKWII